MTVQARGGLPITAISHADAIIIRANLNQNRPAIMIPLAGGARLAILLLASKTSRFRSAQTGHANVAQMAERRPRYGGGSAGRRFKSDHPHKRQCRKIQMRLMRDVFTN